MTISTFRIVASSLLALLVAEASARADCTVLAPETCANGVDDDCDAHTNEGCSTCTGTVALFPYTMSSLAELRTDTNATNTLYGMLVDTTWDFLPSHRIRQIGFRFSTFNTENNFDFLLLGGVDPARRQSHPVGSIRLATASTLQHDALAHRH